MFDFWNFFDSFIAFFVKAESLLQSLPSVETEPDAAEVEKQLKALIGKDGEELCPIRGVKKEKVH